MPSKELVARGLTAVYSMALLLTVASWIVDRRAERFLFGVLFGTLNVPASTSLVSAVVLALVVGALARRKRVALLLVGLFQLVGTVWSAVLLSLWLGGTVPASPGRERALEYTAFVLLEGLAVVLGLGLLGMVWWLRPAFPARLRPGSRREAASVLMGGVLASLLITAGLTHMNSSGSGADESPALTALAVLRRSLGIDRPHDAEIIRHVGPLVPIVVELLLSLTLIAAAWVFLRSSHVAGEWSGENEVAVRRLLTHYGDGDSLGYFATRRDRSYAFASNGAAVIAYRLVGGVALASGDPIGPRASWPSAVASWLEISRRYGWLPAATAMRPEGARCLAGFGFNVAPLGDEAILSPASFTLDSTSKTAVRRAVTRAVRAGVTVRIRRQWELGVTASAELFGMADEWRRGDQRGFSMALGRAGDLADGRCLVVSAHDREDRLVGILTFVPWGTGGLSLDLMRRAPDAPPGVTEVMVTELMAFAAKSGISRVSLNFAVARSVFADAEKLGAGPLIRAGSGLLGLLDRFTQIESLYRSNEKYRPDWRPRYVCFQGTPSILPTAVAIARAEGLLRFVRHRSTTASQRLTPKQLETTAAFETAPPKAAASPLRRSDQTAHRLRHLAELRSAGIDPHRVGRAGGTPLRNLGRVDAAGTSRVTGRVCRIRRHGDVVFADLVDGEVTVQIVLEAERTGRASVRLFGRCVDPGDLVVLDVEHGRSRTGTPSLLVETWDVAAKSLHPVPYGGLTDPGERARRRTLDLLVHSESANRLRQRSAVIQTVRDVLLGDGFLEVETPVLVATNGGATARPFRTLSNAYQVELLLRIAPELQLKRLLAGDLGAIFEIGRSFRNEGADLTHNPEFTVVEAYRPFADYNDMRLLTERVVRAAARVVHGAEAVPLPGPDGCDELVDVSGRWPVITLCDAVSNALGEQVTQTTDLDTLLMHAQRYQVAVRDEMGPGAVLEQLYGALVEPVTMQPTFFTDFPVETSPLTAPHRTSPGLVERWDLVLRGTELATAYSELTDPIEQRRRLTQQSSRAAAGDVEAMELDEDFLLALETGMAPAGGLGIGLDRLVMLLTSATIRDVLSFPFVRPLRERTSVSPHGAT